MTVFSPDRDLTRYSTRLTIKYKRNQGPTLERIEEQTRHQDHPQSPQYYSCFRFISSLIWVV